MNNLIVKAIDVYKKEGIFYIIRSVTNYLLNKIRIYFLYYCYYKIFKSSSTFTFQGKSYRYFYHPYNVTWKKERVIEVPIIWRIIEENKGKNILEIGNVLSHYFPIKHDVIDRYEKAKGVINQDVVDFNPNKKYDLIVSISTLEHVGWDEEPKEPMKILRAIANLMSLLSPRGRIVVTLPIGYNPVLDKLLAEGKIPFHKAYYYERISWDKWIETKKESACSQKFGTPFPNANGLVIGIIENIKKRGEE